MHETLEPECVKVRPTAQPGTGPEVLADGTRWEIGSIAPEEEEPEAVGLFEDVPGGLGVTLREIRDGPNVDLLPDRLQFQTSVRKLVTKEVIVRNTGTAVVKYEWQLIVPPQGFAESILPKEPT
jgi:hypothetical protein